MNSSVDAVSFCLCHFEAVTIIDQREKDGKCAPDCIAV